MIKNYFKIAFRNLFTSKVHSFINIIGLSIGMTTAILIGLWIWDEVSFDQYHRNEEHITQLKQHVTINNSVQTWTSMPLPLGDVIRKTYGSDFKYVVMASWNGNHILTAGNKQLKKEGIFFEPQAPDMLTLRMLKGTRDGLKDPHSILLNESLARSIFGDADPIGQVMTIDNRQEAKVTGVYADIPYNSSFYGTDFIAPWELYTHSEPWILTMENPWGLNGFQIYAQLNDHADINKVSAKIRNAKLDHMPKDERGDNPALFLHPMTKWHLYSDFKNGVNTGGRIQYVWLFGIIGVFVLLLACINFMNLSTARSEKRAKEVGIRKAIGSARKQLIVQFFCESLLIVAIAFVFSLLLTDLILPFFNVVADKKISIPWFNPAFWLLGLGFSLFTGIIAGSYPALYLSAFKPVKVLKGSFRAGRLAAIPRQALVVLQFSVSVILIIGTIVVYRQIGFAKNRPVGYSREGLISVPFLIRDSMAGHLDAMQHELTQSGNIISMTESESPLTAIWSTNGGFDWKGKDPGFSVDMPNTGVSYNFGRTVGWEFKEGRDFSKTFSGDSTAFVLNESAVRLMGLQHPVGEIIKWDGHPFTVIGVIRDMLVESPYEAVRPSLFHLGREKPYFAILKINPQLNAHTALSGIETIFKKYNPAQPFVYQFANEEYAKKFGNEERIGRLASGFAVLAIFISCLGLFGMASFMAEQRVKEIGVRKVLGASVFHLWRLLSKDFVKLVALSLLIACPLAWYLMNTWLQNYAWHSPITWWIFAAAGLGAMLITLATVSFQAIRTALANPIKSLRPE